MKRFLLLAALVLAVASFSQPVSGQAANNVPGCCNIYFNASVPVYEGGEETWSFGGNATREGATIQHYYHQYNRPGSSFDYTACSDLGTGSGVGCSRQGLYVLCPSGATGWMTAWGDTGDPDTNHEWAPARSAYIDCNALRGPMW